MASPCTAQLSLSIAIVVSASLSGLINQNKRHSTSRIPCVCISTRNSAIANYKHLYDSKTVICSLVSAMRRLHGGDRSDRSRGKKLWAMFPSRPHRNCVMLIFETVKESIYRRCMQPRCRPRVKITNVKVLKSALISALKCIKSVWRPGSAWTRWESLQSSSEYPLARFKSFYSGKAGYCLIRVHLFLLPVAFRGELTDDCWPLQTAVLRHIASASSHWQLPSIVQQSSDGQNYRTSVTIPLSA